MDEPAATATTGTAPGRPDPRGARTVPQFMERLRDLKRWSGMTYRQIERQAACSGVFLPHSTVAGALSRNRLPRRELLVGFVGTCGCPPEEVAMWEAAHAALAAGSTRESAAVPARVEQAAAPRPESSRQAIAQRAVRPVSAPKERRAGAWRRGLRAGAGLLAVAILTSGSFVGEPATDRRPSGNQRMAQCPEPMMLGMQSPCVRELQRHLQQHGLDLPADGWFGPYTKMRVMAFQALEGLPPSARVDAATKRAALDRRTALIPRQSRTQIEHRIRTVFTTAPSEAAALARCLSNLDPLQVIGYPYGRARWGLFQFSDFELRELGVTPATALDAEWNIQAAHTIWKRTKSFRNWKCLPATEDPRS